MSAQSAEATMPEGAELSDEIYCIPSARRRTLLKHLGQVLGTDEIPVAFWASLQVCDVDVLEDLVVKATVSPAYILTVSKHTIHGLLLLWLQKPSKDLLASNDAETSRKKRKYRNKSAIDIAWEQDGKSCVLRKVRPAQACHIYPTVRDNLGLAPTIRSKDHYIWLLTSQTSLGTLYSSALLGRTLTPNFMIHPNHPRESNVSRFSDLQRLFGGLRKLRNGDLSCNLCNMRE